MQKEKTGIRDGAYSAWHRSASTRRFLKGTEAAQLSMIDIDTVMWVEANVKGRVPVALIETAIDNGQHEKCGEILRNLADRAGIPCFKVLYTLADRQNPADPCWKDIASFRIKRMHPNEEQDWRTVTPEQWAKALLRIREFGAKAWTN